MPLPTPTITIMVYLCCRYGSIPEYLASAGFTLQEQQTLKSIFLEDF